MKYFCFRISSLFALLASVSAMAAPGRSVTCVYPAEGRTRYTVKVKPFNDEGAYKASGEFGEFIGTLTEDDTDPCWREPMSGSFLECTIDTIMKPGTMTETLGYYSFRIGSSTGSFIGELRRNVGIKRDLVLTYACSYDR